MKIISSVISIAIAIFVFAQCTPKIAKVAENTNTAPESAATTITYSSAELEKGMTIMTEKCGRCHVLFEPADFNQSEWKEILKAMIPKAKLNEADAALVTAYIMNNAKK